MEHDKLDQMFKVHEECRIQLFHYCLFFSSKEIFKESTVKIHFYNKELSTRQKVDKSINDWGGFI